MKKSNVVAREGLVATIAGLKDMIEQGEGGDLGGMLSLLDSMIGTLAGWPVGGVAMPTTMVDGQEVTLYPPQKK